MSQITVSLETAKKIKKVWWEKETYFVWVEWWKLWQPSRSEVHSTEVMRNRIVTADAAYNIYQAQTAQEFLDELPSDIEDCSLDIWKINDTYWVEYSYLQTYIDWTKFSWHKTLVEALAELRLRCKENWYI